MTVPPESPDLFGQGVDLRNEMLGAPVDAFNLRTEVGLELLLLMTGETRCHRGASDSVLPPRQRRKRFAVAIAWGAYSASLSSDSSFSRRRACNSVCFSRFVDHVLRPT